MPTTPERHSFTAKPLEDMLVHDHWLERPRLLGAKILPPLWVLAGVPGSGKTVLVNQVAQRLRLPVVTATIEASHSDEHALIAALRAAFSSTRMRGAHLALSERPATPQDMVAALRRALRATDEGVVLCIDGAHNLTDRAAELLARFAADLPGGHHLAVLADRVTGSLARLRLLTPAIVTPETLAMTKIEARALFDAAQVALAPRDLDMLHAASGGHPLQLHACAQLLASSSPDGRHDLVTRLGAATSPLAVALATVAHARSLKRQLGLLAQFEGFTWEVARECGISDDLLEALGTFGLVDVIAASGDARGPRLRLARAVRQAVALPRLSQRAAQRISRILLAHGEFASAVAILLDARAFRALANTITAAEPALARQYGGYRLSNTIAAVPPDALRRQPQLLLAYIRVLRDTGQLQTALDVLAESEQLKISARQRALLRLEHLVIAVRPDNVSDETRSMLATLAQRLDATRADVAARIAEVSGMCAIAGAQPGWQEVANAELERAHDAYVVAGEPFRAAACDVLCVAHVFLPSGAITSAIDRIDRALEHTDSALLPTALALRARARAHQGHTIRATVDLDEAQQHARLIGLDTTDIDRIRRQVAATPARRRPGGRSDNGNSEVSVRVLGTLEVRHQGTPVAIDDIDVRTLIAVLAAHGGRMHRRELLTTLFERADSDAANDWLTRTQAAVSLPHIEQHGDFIGFGSGTQIDVWEFLELAREALQTPRATSDHAVDRMLAERALDHYGELVPGRDDRWLESPRRRFRHRALDLLDALLALPATSPGDRTRWAQRALTLTEDSDPRRQRYEAIANTSAH